MSRPSRNAGLVRVLSLLRVLEGRGRYTLHDLADRFSVATRTIRRDFEALECAGYPIGHDERGDGSSRGEWWLA
jgi:predicted DNA-binding transcriptional regulator YafY